MLKENLFCFWKKKVLRKNTLHTVHTLFLTALNFIFHLKNTFMIKKKKNICCVISINICTK